MLIEFSVTNYLSMRDRQTLTMTAAYNPEELPDAVMHPNLPSMSGYSFLKGAALYGANASGKSNILGAMAFMRNYVRRSAIDMVPDEETGLTPFLLTQDAAAAPGEFEIVFAHKGVRYDYGFALDKTRILSEWLYAYPRGRPRKIFVRDYDERKKEYMYEFGQDAAGYSDHKKKTRPNALFLSMGAQFNAAELLPPYEWFAHYFQVLNLSEAGISPAYTALQIIEKPEVRRQYSNLLREADLGVEDIEVANEGSGERAELRIHFLHSCPGNNAPVKLALEAESAGTKRLFSLLTLWHDVLETGMTLCVDELEASLHPLLIRKLIKMICGPQNTSGAQLIFTTHNTNLLDASLLRRDQIWFTEKDPDGATQLYPLSDYRPRKDEMLQKGYLAGRYGAIPMLREDFSFYE